MILHRAGDDLGCRSREFVDQNHQRRSVGIPVGCCVSVVVGTIATFLSKDQFAGRKKSVGNPDCLFEKPARIAAQIEHERSHAPPMQKLEGVLQTFIRVVVESARHINVTNAGTNHVGVRHRRLGHRSADNFYQIGFAGGCTSDVQLHMCVTRPANLVANLGRRFAVHGNAVNLVDAIAKTQTRTLGRRILERRRDIGFHLIADRKILNGRADAEVFAALIGLHLLELFFVEVVRVRIERPQHADDRRLIDAIEVELVAVDIVFLDDTQRFGEILLDCRSGGVRRAHTRAPIGPGSRRC